MVHSACFYKTSVLQCDHYDIIKMESRLAHPPIKQWGKAATTQHANVTTHRFDLSNVMFLVSLPGATIAVGFLCLGGF